MVGGRQRALIDRREHVHDTDPRLVARRECDDGLEVGFALCFEIDEAGDGSNRMLETHPIKAASRGPKRHGASLQELCAQRRG